MDDSRMGSGMTRQSGNSSPVWTIGSRTSAAWDGRLEGGLAVARVPQELRATLVRSLGEAGVEAESFLRSLDSLTDRQAASRAAGQGFLLQLEAAALRLPRVAAGFEMAAQGYLTALEAAYPELRTRGEADEVWWPAFPGYALPDGGLELGLRRCGFAYRHVVEAHLASNVEAVAEILALTLHALGSLPPAGILPAKALHQGIYELSSAWQGEMVQGYIFDVRAGTPGLLTGIATLRALDAKEGASLADDLAWARARYDLVRDAQPGQRWADHAAREWRETIAALERMPG